ncbi:hypothetical protein [Sphingomonas sp.]|uniref:hypothetical protein n=1 Tax=Sphingomonas sp. TaxID=28214 RepID=UPI003BABCF44
MTASVDEYDPDNDPVIEVGREASRELANAWMVIRTQGLTKWKIRVRDIDAGTARRQLLWVEIDTSENPVYTSGPVKELWRIDCLAKTQRVEYSERFDRQGRSTSTRFYEGARMTQITPAIPVDAVRVAFCAPDLE